MLRRRWLLVLYLQVCGAFLLKSSSMSAIQRNAVSDVIDVVGKVIEGGFDVAEDALTHARRMPMSETIDSCKSCERLVILGSGWGGHAMIKVLDVEKYDVTVVSPTNNFVFTPFLPAVAVGTVDARSASETIRRSNPLVEYIDAEATDIDFEKKELSVKYTSLGPHDVSTGGIIQYDKLVIATGVQVNTALAQGAEEYAFKLKTSDDAIKLRRAITLRLERAAQTNISEEERRRLLTFVLCGAGPTAIELAGELSDFNNDIKRRFPRLESMPKVIVVEAASSILPPFSEEQRLVAQSTLENAGVEFILNTFVKKVSDASITVFDRSTEKTYEIACGIVAWAAGTTTIPFIQTVLNQLPESAKAAAGGKICVDEWLRINVDSAHHAFGDVYALGDCAQIIDTDLPQTAQVASQAGAHLARFLNRRYDAKATPPTILPNDEQRTAFETFWITALRQATQAPKFAFLNLGILAYLGAGQALARVQLGDIPLRSTAGKEAFAIWRSVYLAKQVSARSRILVLLDWFKTRVFGRDITRL